MVVFSGIDFDEVAEPTPPDGPVMAGAVASMSSSSETLSSTSVTVMVTV